MILSGVIEELFHRDALQIKRLTCAEKYGRIDFLVNNGGGQFPCAAADMKLKVTISSCAAADMKLKVTISFCAAADMKVKVIISFFAAADMKLKVTIFLLCCCRREAQDNNSSWAARCRYSSR